MSSVVSSKITGKEYPLSKIFSSDFEYHIPGYQRPYAWTEDETGALFDDLYGFFQTENTENFFLGSIVLIKDEQNRYADVIDGQQRLTTLSILFAVLADTFVNEDYKMDCKKYLQEKGNVLEGIEAQPRLFLKEKDQPFFHKYIQNIQLDALGQLDPAVLDTEAKLHIQKNCAVLRKSFAEMFSNDDDRLRFTQFLLTRCYLVVVSTPSQESAFRIFTVMNSRGLDLLPTDIIKSTVIGSLPKEKQQGYTEKWEGLASYLLVTAQDVNHRVDRYKWLLVEMESRPDSALADPLRNIELTDWEKEQFQQTLDGEIYTMTAQRRNYIIQRLDSFMSDGGASYNQKLFTIEHVLPQHPPVHGSWLELWPDEQERKYWLNRVANLVPLTRQRNSAAQNYGFATKKEKYFQSKGGTSSYVLTTQVINEPVWTPDVVKKRQAMLSDVFAEKWELNPSRQSGTDEGLFLLAGRGSSAMGYPIDKDCFLVLKGSRIAPDVTSGLPQNYVEQRKTLLGIGIIQNNVFAEDNVFTSASAAASIILGRSSNGRREWAKLDGRTLAQSGH